MALAKATTNKERRTDIAFIPTPMAPNQQIANRLDDLHSRSLLPAYTLYNPYFQFIGSVFSESTLCDEPYTVLWTKSGRLQHRCNINDD